MPRFRRIQIVDSHTGGEPTRVVIAGGPDFGVEEVAVQRQRFAELHDMFRSAVVNEPRGSDIVVGAMLVTSSNPNCICGAIFFNNVGYLGMCGHGTIGLAVTLGHLGRIGPGRHLIESPVGIVGFEYDGQNSVAIENVPSYRHLKDVVVDVPGYGKVCGDVAWGGNWFFLVHDHKEELDVKNAERLTEVTWQIRKALCTQGVTGKNGAEIDHIELFGPPRDPANHSRNFVLCPGKAYDRSPCGTGTSAKLACLYADGKLQPRQNWRQESILGSVFEGSVEVVDGVVHPTIRGTAYITSEGSLLIDSQDPLGGGIRS